MRLRAQKCVSRNIFAPGVVVGRTVVVASGVVVGAAVEVARGVVVIAARTSRVSVVAIPTLQPGLSRTCLRTVATRFAAARRLRKPKNAGLAPGVVVGRAVVVGAAVVVPRGVEVGAAVVVARGVDVGAAVVVARGVVVTAGQQMQGVNSNKKRKMEKWK